MDTTVSDFTGQELELVAELLQQRYSKHMSPELADSELKLDPASDELTVCPTLYWSERGAHFVLCKIAQGRYKCQFFYADADQYGTGHDEYTDLRRCVLTLLRVQADHASQSAGISSGATAIDLPAGSTDDDYHGPLVI
ncbi:hypothetical protein [Rhodoferax sp.]|uniref:hypothetical protein n=1 Tax=Rhodoferax sp. TaxID=50421 RepID=UPI002635155A|nr:hypothetical protein [Rhodoferax sp.]MDD2917582.1 hypothetical protein [Rhodoferax sp.]